MSFIVGALLVLGTAQVAAKPAPDVLASLYSRAIIQKLSQTPGWEFNARAFFSDAPAVPRERLSGDLIKSCEEAMAIRLKKQFVPPNLHSLWFGIQQAFPTSDMVMAEFHAGHYGITWVDSEFSLDLYIRDMNSVRRPLDKDGIDEMVKKEAVDLLQLPPKWESIFKFNTAEEKTGSESLWYALCYDLSEKPSAAGTYTYRPEWSSHISFFTDGVTTRLSVPSGRGGYQSQSNTHVSRFGSDF